jgi:hypothetical protein
MSKLFDDFKGLIDSRVEEAPLQAFLKRYPRILIDTFNQGAQYPTVFPKFKLADELIPDFITIGRRSGTQYTSWDVDLIEIEPSILAKPLFNKKGQITGRLRDAEGQIIKWQQWMKINEQRIFVPKALKELKRKHAWDEHPQFYNPSHHMHQSMLISYRIIIGRRKDFGDIGDEYRINKWEESGRRFEIVPWDRLLDRVHHFAFTG